VFKRLRNRVLNTLTLLYYKAAAETHPQPLPKGGGLKRKTHPQPLPKGGGLKGKPTPNPSPREGGLKGK